MALKKPGMCRWKPLKIDDLTCHWVQPLKIDDLTCHWVHFFLKLFVE